MRKIFIITLLVTLCFSSPSIAQDKKYNVGVIIPLSGDAAGLGSYVKKGIDLGYASLSKEDRERISLIFEDDRLESATAVTAFKKLSAANNIKAAFVLGSGVGNAVSPLAEKSQTLLIAIGASDKAVVAGKKYAFLHWISPEAEAKKLVQEVKKRNLKRIALISAEQAGAIALDEAFRGEMEREGLSSSLVLSERYLTDARDFKPFLAKIRANKIDGICTALLPGALSSLAKQARDMDLKAELFGFETFEDRSEVVASNGSLEGKWYVNADDASPEFQKSFEAAYHEPPGWASANAYDSVRLLAEAVRKYSDDNDKIAEFLRSLRDYDGAFGRYSATGDNRFILPTAVKVVTNGGFEKLYK